MEKVEKELGSYNHKNGNVAKRKITERSKLIK